jgi:hypothetical protein
MFPTFVTTEFTTNFSDGGERVLLGYQKAMLISRKQCPG